MVPVIAVDAPVMRLGLNADGTLQVPTVYSEAGWYDGGPKPGDVGPAVIVGHVDSQTGPAVFYRLHELQPGDRITVDMAGKRKTFVVQQIRRYPKDAFPTHLVYGPTEVPALRLITCGGSFDFVTGHYSDNIVVFANLAASPL